MSTTKTKRLCSVFNIKPKGEGEWDIKTALLQSLLLVLTTQCRKTLLILKGFKTQLKETRGYKNSRKRPEKVQFCMASENENKQTKTRILHREGIYWPLNSSHVMVLVKPPGRGRLWWVVQCWWRGPPVSVSAPALHCPANLAGRCVEPHDRSLCAPTASYKLSLLPMAFLPSMQLCPLSSGKTFQTSSGSWNRREGWTSPYCGLSPCTHTVTFDLHVRHNMRLAILRKYNYYNSLLL